MRSLSESADLCVSFSGACELYQYCYSWKKIDIFMLPMFLMGGLIMRAEGRENGGLSKCPGMKLTDQMSKREIDEQ